MVKAGMTMVFWIAFPVIGSLVVYWNDAVRTEWFASNPTLFTKSIVDSAAAACASTADDIGPAQAHITRAAL